MAGLRVGTSGYAYKEWKGSFYPEKLPEREMLRFYSQQFQTVEINHTFYRMPSERVLEQWGASVEGDFEFALKANQRITHVQKLRDAAETLKRFLEVSSVLAQESRLGPILIQSPPSFQAELGVLDDFLALRPRAFRFAVEFRHRSWQTEETYAVLRRHGVALCLAETDDAEPPRVLTAEFIYVRLRKESYAAKELAAWKQRFAEWVEQGIDVYAYLKHEEAGKAPAYARRLLD
ncbi:MAG: DUF72 domain-containing protein [Acidobacteria bacterium]|nr:DUF72 domain-containing protein [Acidobacteriota bacterium]